MSDVLLKKLNIASVRCASLSKVNWTTVIGDVGVPRDKSLRQYMDGHLCLSTKAEGFSYKV